MPRADRHRTSLRARSIALAAILVAASLVGPGCVRRPSLEFRDDGKAYSLAEIESVARNVDVSAYLNLPVSGASALRTRYLGRLRRLDEPAPAFAETYTRTFGGQKRSVPVYVEAAEVEGREAWVIVEVWGPEGGCLAATRSWVLDRATGDVISSTSFH